MASDDTREAEQRLAAALERIADMADQGLTRIRPPSVAAEGRPIPQAAPQAAHPAAPPAAEVVARLDALIERLRDALGHDAFGR